MSQPVTCAFCGNTIPSNAPAYVRNGKPCCAQCNAARTTVESVRIYAKRDARSFCSIIGGMFVAVGLIGLALSVAAIVYVKLDHGSGDPGFIAYELQRRDSVMTISIVTAFGSMLTIGMGAMLVGIGRIARAFP